uniref:Uncharacterized protein n=1 Tax=Oryza sativa subsp. japonica TaxID=39947 RepID=Q94H44_ORYSJ|nr:hypothetical protein [Oryza sativa Japonica Group]
MGRRPILSFLPPSLLGRPQAEAQPGRPAALLSRGRRQVGPTCRVLPPPPAAPGAPPRPQPLPRPRLRLLRATSTTSALAPRLPRPLPSLSRPRPRPRWPGFDFRIPPLSPPPLPTSAGDSHLSRPRPVLSPYLIFSVAPSRFFPISPTSPEPPIAPAPCNLLPPLFPLLRPPLAAARVAAAPRRLRRRVRKAKLHPGRPFPVEFRRRNSPPLALRAPGSSSAGCRILPWLAVAVRHRLPPRRPPSVRHPSPLFPFLSS